MLIDNNYAYIEYVTGDYFIVAKNGKNGIIDGTGKNVVSLKYTSIFRLNDTNLLQAEISQTNTIELYNLQMEQIASMDEAIIREYNVSSNNDQKYIVLASDSDFAYYDVNGNQLQAKDILKNNTLFARKINDQWGFVDSNENLKVGDDVRMENAEQVGTIIAINGNQAEISLNGLRVKTKLSSLTKMPKQKVSNKTHFERKPRAKKEVVLVGMRVEEALPLMEKYLDDAYASKMSQVRIVHGIGTGTLRKAIHEKLKKLRFVKEYHLADYYDGGSAVTIVEFK